MPQSPIPPEQPRTFTRPNWNPMATGTSGMEVFPVVGTPGVVSTQIRVTGNLRQNEPFQVWLDVANGQPKVIYIRDAIPYFDPENTPGAFGHVSAPGYPEIPTGISATLSVGLLPVAPGATITLSYGAVVFLAGTVLLGAEVYLSDGRLLEPPELPVAITAIV